MRRFHLYAPLAVMLLAGAVAGCASTPGWSSNVAAAPSRAATPDREVQTVGYKGQAAEESVVLEADLPPESGGSSGWTRLLNPFQRSERIPLPLSPKSDHGDASSEATGF